MGGDQLQGYAVPLILGILMCMFTAIFVSRLVFEIAERQRWIKKLTMMELLAEPKFNLFGKRGIAAVLSVVLIVVGIGAASVRGSKIFDIDLNGGHSVTMEFKESTDIGTVRTALLDAKIADNISVTGIGDQHTRYKIDASRSADSTLQKIKDSVAGVFSGQMQTYDVQVTSAPVAVAAVDSAGDSTSTDSATSDSPSSGSDAEISTPNDVIPEGEGTSDPVTGPNDGDSSFLPRKSLNGELVAYTPFSPASLLIGQADETSTDAEVATGSPAVQRSKAELHFGTKLNAETLETELLQSFDAVGLGQPALEFENKEWNGRGKKSYPDWTVTASVSPEDFTKALDHFTNHMKESPVWLSEAEVGSKIAGDTTNSAVAAIVFSLLGIVGYIWIRFQRVSFGLAAVVALVHDVLITIGFNALSYWIVQSIPPLAAVLMIDEFKISLPVVAAILTIIGYSLNDTIVVFDRIREVRGKSPEIREEMINTSINQTLSRTILTSTTTLIAVGILYVLGGAGIHPFSFALLVGVIVGTYSSIFIASPALMWMSGAKDVATPAEEKVAV
ncbi:MAG: protein translocase subunit SecF [Planctomycetales bacterium]|nr:protein translocase subunit SecF [Planctomycetales bacterium]